MDAMFEFTVPSYIKGLGGLKAIIQKAREHGVDEEKLLQDRLAPDMFPLVRQIQIATDQAKGIVGRVTKIEAPKYEDTETTFDQLLQRIDATIAFLQTVKKEDFANASEAKVTLPYFPGKFMAGFDYVREYSIPNFYFHVAIAYAIIRKNDVNIGKADYMNGLPLQDL